MKEWKEEILKKMEEHAKHETTVYIHDIAKEIGIKHIKTEDCRDILYGFKKRHPQYEIIKLYRNNNNESLFEAGAVTISEYETTEDLIEEVEGKTSTKTARKKAGLTQREMSKILEIPERTIAAWESGERTPNEWTRKLVVEKLESLDEEIINKLLEK